MSTNLSIEYKDPVRPKFDHPFGGYFVLRDYWRPIAEKHGLKVLQRVEFLFIKDRSEAEELIRELRIVEAILRSPERGDVPEPTAQGMLDRLSILLPVLDGALGEWQDVKEVSL